MRSARRVAAGLVTAAGFVVAVGFVLAGQGQAGMLGPELWVDGITPPPTTDVPPTTTTTTVPATTTTMGTVTTILPAVLPDFDVMLRRQGDGYGVDTDVLIELAHAACDTTPAEALAASPGATGLLMVAIGVGVLCPERYDPAWPAPTPAQ